MIERLVWNIFDHSEGYTFFLVWVVVPMSFLACFIWLRGMSVAVPSAPVPVPVKVPEKTPEVPKMELVKGDPKINTNEANA